MAVRMDKPWIALADTQGRIHGNMGVFELADANDEIVFIGFAGGASLYGLKGEVAAAGKALTDAEKVRVEVNTAYLSRYRELLMAYVADHGELPKHNTEMPPGRLSPA